MEGFIQSGLEQMSNTCHKVAGLVDCGLICNCSVPARVSGCNSVASSVDLGLVRTVGLEGEDFCLILPCPLRL